LPEAPAREKLHNRCTRSRDGPDSCVIRMRCKDQISPPDPNSQNRQPPSSCRFRIRFKVTIAVVSR